MKPSEAGEQLLVEADAGRLQQVFRLQVAEFQSAENDRGDAKSAALNRFVSEDLAWILFADVGGFHHLAPFVVVRFEVCIEVAR